MGKPEICKTSPVLFSSFERAAHAEDIPLKFSDSLSERKQKEKLRIWAIALCIVSIILNLVLCILGIVFASIRYSPATFAFAADCILDFLSSSVVIWRYFGSPYTLYSSTKENTACISLGVLFIAAGIGVIVEGSFFLITKDVPKWFTILIILAATGFAACVLLGIAKYMLSKKMQSKTLFLDALNSFLSALCALVIIVSDVVYLSDENIWYLDPVLSIILSLGLISYGAYTIISHCRKISYLREEI